MPPDRSDRDQLRLNQLYCGRTLPRPQPCGLQLLLNLLQGPLDLRQKGVYSAPVWVHARSWLYQGHLSLCCPDAPFPQRRLW